MPKVKRNTQRKPLMEKLESGGLGGSFRPSSRPAYDKNAQMYREINDGLGKLFKWGLSFTEGLMDEVFDVKVGSHKVKRVTKKKAFRF
ncbi:MAG TPA: hypothetical protein VEP90_10185 [Methylomirabilota bacterium]|nr:hypothetical protein [Methylomirabilota bacterium]